MYKYYIELYFESSTLIWFKMKSIEMAISQIKEDSGLLRFAGGGH